MLLRYCAAIPKRALIKKKKNPVSSGKEGGHAYFCFYYEWEPGHISLQLKTQILGKRSTFES